MSGKKNFYIVRLRKDDSIVAVGTAKECVRLMGLRSVKCFYSVLSKNRSGKYNRYEIDIMDESDDEG